MSENGEKERKYCHPEFSKKTGVEVYPSEKVDKKKNPVCGTVTMRFFPFEKATHDGHIRYLMEPAEANDIAYHIRQVIASTKAYKKKMPPHKFVKDGVNILTTLTIEHYITQPNGEEKHNYAIVVNRGEGKDGNKPQGGNQNNSITINVPMAIERLLFIARLLEEYSIKQSWVMSDYARPYSVTDDGEESPVGAQPDKGQKGQRNQGGQNSQRSQGGQGGQRDQSGQAADTRSSQQSTGAPADRTRLKQLVDSIKKNNVDMKKFLDYFNVADINKFPDNRVDEALQLIATTRKKAA